MRNKDNNKKWKMLPFIWSLLALAIISFVLHHSSTHTLWHYGKILLKLFLLVGITSFIGAIFEYQAWTRFIVFLAYPLIKFGKLPSISGVSFITALFSNNAANTLITGSYTEGNINHREMFISGLCNAYPAMVSHSLRIFFPLLGLVGMASVWYYSFTFGIGLLMTLSFLLISRILAKKEEKLQTTNSANLIVNDDKNKERLHKRYDWQQTLKHSTTRTGKTLLRLLYITTPIYLLVSYMSKNHLFDFWKHFIPNSMENFLTPEIMTVLSARLGGLVCAASAASKYLNNGEITTLQIVLAFLIGNIITNPIRTIRRNLPTALGIFPGRNGLWIVLILQGLRFIFTFLAIIILLKVKV